MNFTAPEDMRRATTDEVRRRLASKPSGPWLPPTSEMAGVVFDLESTFELATLQNSFGSALPGLPDTHASSLKRHTRIHAAGAFRATEGIGSTPASRMLEHLERGAVYVDLADKTFLHFGAEQLPATPCPGAARTLELKWRVDRGPRELTISVRGMLSLDVRLELSAEKPMPRDACDAVLRAVLPGLEQLQALGLPLDSIADVGVPVCAETWLVDDKGARRARLARHRVTIRSVGAISPSVFGIPSGFRDLRARRDQEAAWFTLGTYSQPRPRVTRARRTPRAAHTAHGLAQTMATLGPGVWDAKPEFPSEPLLPHCRPQTLHASASFEIRQSLLDAIQSVLNAIGSRLDEVSGSRVDPSDPENLTVRFDVDWLDQLAGFSDGLPQGDGLYCLLREVPGADGLGGGGGLLDRLAESLARQLLSREDPLPLGGEDDPVALPAAVRAEIEAVVEDSDVALSARFDALDPTTQAQMREAILSQRIANVRAEFNGDFGETIWPSAFFDLVHVRLRLQSLRLQFADDRELLRGLRITLIDGDANRPQIEFELALRRFEATLTMERWPGVHFWVTAGGTLVALSIVGPLAIGPTLLLLMGLGPLGILVLFTLISTAPVAMVAGGAALLAVVAYIVWDTSELRLSIDRPVLRSSVAPDRRADPGTVFLDADRASLDGDVTASVNSQIPSGVHQLLDVVVNFALEAFEDQVRAVLEDRAVEGLEEALLRLPHFRAPLPFDARLEIPVGVPGSSDVLMGADAPSHELLHHGADGRADQRLAANAVTRLSYPFHGFSHLVTQVDPDLRAHVLDSMQRSVAEDRTPRLGYGLSQNLLNGNVFAQWLGGRYHVDYEADRARAAIDLVAHACRKCAESTERVTGHTWAASPPQVHVAPRLYVEGTERAYMSTFWPDVRLCLRAVFGKPATLELRFAVHSLAHVGFGTAGEDRKLSFFSFENDFLRVLFDHRDPYLSLDPVELHGVEVHGAGFDAIAGMDRDQRLLFLQAMQPLMLDAARLLLRIDGVRRLTFLPGSNRVDQQVYDGVVQVDIEPRRTSLVAVVTTHGPIALVLPRRDASDQLVPPALDLDTQTCADGVVMRTLLG